MKPTTFDTGKGYDDGKGSGDAEFPAHVTAGERRAPRVVTRGSTAPEAVVSGPEQQQQR